MKTPEFNLLEEAWIRVLKDDCSEELVSLPEAMIHAHEYRDLCGDTPEPVSYTHLFLYIQPEGSLIQLRSPQRSDKQRK